MFNDAVASSQQPMSGEEGILYIYGIYLAHGGTPEGFENMTATDIQIMYTAYEGTRQRNHRESLRNAVHLVKALFGQDGGE